MKRLLRQAEGANPESAAMLRIIDQFDELTASAASMEKLARAAARICRRSVLIHDSWNGRSIWVTKGAVVRGAAPDDVASAVMTAVVNARLRGRRSSILDVDDREVLAANMEAASGWIGTVWLEPEDTPWSLRDHVVAERLAAAVVTDAITTNASNELKSAVDTASVERLLAGGLSEGDAAVHIKQAQLPPGRLLMAVAVGELPRATTSPDALAQMVSREFARARIVARSTLIGAHVALLVEDSPDVVAVLEELSVVPRGSGSILSFGLGEPAEPHALDRSWEQAREALLLRTLATSERRVARFRDLGLLHLLARIPEQEVTSFSDYIKVAALADSGGSPNDLELLEVFCESGSLRGASTAIFLHFTTVRARLAKISSQLELDLNDPSDRLRAHVAVKLVQVHRARQLDQSLRAGTSLKPAAPRRKKGA